MTTTNVNMKTQKKELSRLIKNPQKQFSKTVSKTIEPSKNFMKFKEALEIFKKSWKVLALFFVISILLRVLYLPSGAISFAYDQGRDAFVASEIIAGDFKVLGPSVSGVPGLYHGVLYYYFITPFYLLGKGDPTYVAYAMSFFNSMCVFIAFYLSLYLIGNKKIAFLSSLLFVFSFEATQYANLLTNPSMALWLVPLTYLFVLVWLLEKNFWAAFLAGISFGFAVQSEVALLYHIAPILFWIYRFKNNITLKSVATFLGAFLFSISTMLITEVKFGFNGVKGILYLLSRSDGVSQERGILDIFFIYIKQVSEAISNNLFPQSILVGGLIFALILYILVKVEGKTFLKHKFTPLIFLITATAPQIIALPFGGTNMRHIMAGSSVLICIIGAVVIEKLARGNVKVISVFASIIIFLNVVSIISNNRNGQTIFPLQKDLVLEKEIDVLEYTYGSSNGGPFVINTVTSPLWINTLWSYLYNWKGVSEFGYLPAWSGKDQIGQLGNNLPTRSGAEEFTYLIIEPTYGIPERFISDTIEDENTRSKILEEVSFGDIIVQKRINLNNKIN